MDLIQMLKNRSMVNQVHPWHSLDEDLPIYTLMVSVETAMAELKLDLTRAKFLEYLKANDIHVFRNIDEFVKIKDTYKAIAKKKRTQKGPRKITEERLKQLQNQASQMREKQKGSIPEKAL